jgi:phosphinothricin acetyltransferase
MVAVRDLEPADIEAVTRIYAHHVLNDTATFDEIPPSADEMRQRAEKIAGRGLPWLVAEADGAVVGYAYADRFRERTAYRFTLEDSVYIDPAHFRRGIGRTLLKELIARCEALGYRQIIAVIGDSANDGSLRLHGDVGFELCGVYKKVGMKFGRWLDVVLMQRELGKGSADIPSANPV